MKLIIAIILTLISSYSRASFPLEITQKEMASQADHILTGKVVDVDMIDGEGKKITSRQEMTGPGLRNTIRLHVRVEKVLVTSAKDVPKMLIIPLDPFMHYSLGNVQSVESQNHETRLFLLKGENFQPIVAGRFEQPLSEQKQVMKIHKDAHR